MEEVLTQLKEIMGDSFNDLLDAYLADTGKRLDLLRELIDENKLGEVKGIAHAMKGSSRNVGAEEMATICQQLENDSTSQNREGLDQGLESARQVFSNIEKVMESFRV